MSFVAACLARDFRLARTHGPAILMDLVAVIVSAVVFFYLASFVDQGEAYFGFVLAGLTILRIHGAVPRVLQATTGRIADGSLEIVLSGRWRGATVMVGEAAFELLRGVSLSVLLLCFGVGVLGADVQLTAPGLLAVAAGLAGAGLVLLGLAIALESLLMVLREASAASSLSGVFLPILGGVYFPLAILPAPLEQIAWLLPFHWPVDVIRAGLVDGAFPTADALAMLAACVATLAVATVVVEPAVRSARRRGRLALE